jgi:WD40 repeat protein
MNGIDHLKLRSKRRNTRFSFSGMITKQMRMKLCSIFLLLLAIGSVEAEDQFRFLLASNEEQLALVNIATGKISIIDTAEVEDQQSLRNPWGNVTFSPDGKYVIYLRGSEGDKELFIYEPVLEQRTQVTLPPMRRGRIRLLHILGWNEVNQVAVLESPGGGQSIIYKANDRSEPMELGVFLPIKSVSISPRGTWLFLTEKETGKSLLLHTQTSEQVYLSSSPIKAIAWSWDEDVFACADSALKLAISDKMGKTISRVDIDWQGFQPNMFHGLLK